ncbi:MAG: sigma-70 family RNA polymerase sigma factor [Dehalococcoidia bacterium]|nr:sigma-70 family RNA polymerase sigma factor [Dehalococcoidia bacterium]
MRDEVATQEVAESEPYEAELIRRAKARSPEAWSEIYTSHYAAIFRYAKARVFDETTAEDIASAVFVGALKGIDSYKYRGRPLLAWLYGIARNVVASYQRELLVPRGEDQKRSLDLAQRVIWHLMRRSRRDDVRAADHDPVSTGSSEADPAMMVDRLDLRDALANLPANQREVVILRFLVGLSAQEVAEVIGKKPAAVYSLQARAILALREQLK